MKEILKNAIKKALEKLNVGDIEIEINKNINDLTKNFMALKRHHLKVV